MGDGCKRAVMHGLVKLGFGFSMLRLTCQPSCLAPNTPLGGQSHALWLPLVVGLFLSPRVIRGDLILFLWISSGSVPLHSMTLDPVAATMLIFSPQPEGPPQAERGRPTVIMKTDHLGLRTPAV